MNAGQYVLELLMPLFAAAPRLFGLWLMLPLLRDTGAPTVVRNGVVVAIALFCYPMIEVDMPLHAPNDLEWLLIVPKELAIGAGLGYIFSIVIWAFENAGMLIDTQTGTNNAAIMTPSSGSQLGPTGTLARQFAVALFVAAGFLPQLIVGSVESFVAWKWYEMAPRVDIGIQSLLLGRTHTLWQLSLRILAPVMLFILLVEAALGFANRAAPQLNVEDVGMPLKSCAAWLMLCLALTFLSETAISLWRDELDFVINLVRR